MQKCPKCKAEKIEIISANDISFAHCTSCGYDESVHDITPTQKTSQREKGKYSPYKTGRGKRTNRSRTTSPKLVA